MIKIKLIQIPPTQSNRDKIENYILKKCPFIRKETIGKSLCNRPIEAFRIGNQKEITLMAGAFHASEWLTTLVLYNFLNFICENIKKTSLSKFLNKRGIVIIPYVNPDGIEIQINGPKAACEYKDLVEKITKGDTKHWNSNARGVDLNHNYDAGWEKLHKLEIASGITGPASTRYGGTAPESEPETRAMVNFLKKNNISRAYAFHSQGEEIFWDYGSYTPIESSEIADVLAKISGYKKSAPDESLAIGGGFKDWFIEKFSRPGFTIEIGKGKNPLPIENLENIYRKIEKMLILMLKI